MAAAEQLDIEISDLRIRVARLQAHSANLGSVLLSQPQLSARLAQRPVANEGRRRVAAEIAKQQSKRNLENIYRTCAGITAFKVKDPDPNAVDNGNILGVRIDVSAGAQIEDTYHVFFSRQSPPHQNVLRVHRHTVPPCIPLQSLARRWLPLLSKEDNGAVEQDLVSFGKSLRKELVSWHLRIKALEKLREEADLGDRTLHKETHNGDYATGTVLNAFVSDSEDFEDEQQLQMQHLGPAKIVDIDSDTAVRNVNIAWSDGQTGTIVVAKDGEVKKAAFRTRDGDRDAALGRKAVGRIEDLVQRLEH